MSRCEICKEYIYDYQKKMGIKHKCHPKWLCRICGCDDDKYTEEEKAEWFEYEVYAHDAKAAAEKCADDEESNWDYSFIDHGGVDIDVMNPETKEVKKLFVSAEQVIEYYAQERKE